MKTIWKITIALGSEFALPIGAKFLSCGEQNGSPVAWFLVDPSAEKEVRRFFIVPTGGEILDGSDSYMGTVSLPDVWPYPFVAHLFERVEK